MKSLDDKLDYWGIADTIKDIYLSEGVIATLLDYERVLDEMDLYAFKWWPNGELVEGPEITRYSVTCIWLWLENQMPDPRGAKRLIPFGCKVKYKKTTMEVPIIVKDPGDYRPGSHKPRLIKKKVWLVSIEIPKYLINDIRTGSVELENQDIDLSDIDQSFDQDLNIDQYKQYDGNENDN